METQLDAAEPKSKENMINHTYTDFTLGHKEESIDLTFENVTYSVSQGFRKGKRHILQGVNGRFPGKYLVAIMGPSGAGKSTLLDIVSGYRTTGIEGNVYVNGKQRDLNTFRRSSAYITQDDRLQSLLTVSENMRVAADLKLGTDTSHCEKEARIKEILTSLGLHEHAKTRSGNLSGGQRKRLSIALELVNDPTVLFLDEPTTGLDSSSCTQVVLLLRLLAQQGRTIVCTIHQPSASIYQLFDQIYVLARGKCLYQGSTKKLVTYLRTLNLSCPLHYNPADYAIEVSCGEYGEDKIDALVSECGNGKCLDWFVNSEALKNIVFSADDDGQMTIKGHQATSGCYQLMVLLRRGFITVRRDMMFTYINIFVNVVSGLMMGVISNDVGRDAAKIHANYRLLFSFLLFHTTAMMLTILTFAKEMKILQKEHFNRWYSLKAFFISVNIVGFPVSFFCCFLFSAIVYVMSSQPMEVTRFTMFFTISVLVSFVAQSIGLLFGILLNMLNATFFGPTSTIPMMMVSGFGVTLRDIPDYLKWGTHFSYLRFGFEGYAEAIWGRGRAPLECSEIYCHYRNIKVFLEEFDLQSDQFWNDVLILTAMLIFFRVAAYFCLRWKITSSR